MTCIELCVNLMFYLVYPPFYVCFSYNHGTISLLCMFILYYMNRTILLPFGGFLIVKNESPGKKIDVRYISYL